MKSQSTSSGSSQQSAKRSSNNNNNNNNNNRSKKTVALVGPPNSGKTTLYNWLTGSRFRTVNYPGSTVDYSIGSLAPHFEKQSSWQVVDTPGTYSLIARSADEEVTIGTLFRLQVDAVLVVVDGTQLERQLPLVQQIQTVGFSVVLAVTMGDLLRRHKMSLSESQLSQGLRCPVVVCDGTLGGGIPELIEALDTLPPSKPEESLLRQGELLHQALARSHQELQQLAQSVVLGKERVGDVFLTTHRLDRWVLHPLVGPLIFTSLMALLFTAIFWFAAPFMEFIDQGFSWAGDYAKSYIENAFGTPLIADFFSSGVLASFAAVLVFVPQIFILFFGIGILESSGYLSRAAALIDEPFRRVGLSGRSFVPMLSGFACAIPAIMAARNLSSPRDRWITSLVIPLMSCSARLPVYALLLAFLFAGEPAWKPGLALAGIYIFSLLLGGLAAAILNQILPQKERSYLMMEMPLYRRPRLRILIQQALERTRSYVVKAGPVIFTLAIVLWLGTNFPRPVEDLQVTETSQNSQTAQIGSIHTSYIGQVGRWLEPALEPMGADWRIGVSLLSAFAAREVFVASMALVFRVSAEGDDTQQESLLRAMKEATAPWRNDGALFTTATTAALIVFFMIALQCMSTVAILQKETGSQRTAWGAFAVYTVVAYGAAVLTYTLLS